jgi:hypothetical protein
VITQLSPTSNEPQDLGLIGVARTAPGTSASVDRLQAERKLVRDAARATRAAAYAILPERHQRFAGLSLEGLRTYRQTLAEEGERLSYQEAILSARLEAARGERADVDLRLLRPAAANARLHSARTRLGLATGEDLPLLPDLGLLWVDPADPEAAATLIAAADQLTEYREELRSRLRAATRELIARYRHRPKECFSLLPA